MMDRALPLHLPGSPADLSVDPLHAGPRAVDPAAAASARVVATVRAGLNDSAHDTAPDIAERLRFSRERALARARQARLSAATPSSGLVSLAGVTGLAIAGGPSSVAGASRFGPAPRWARFGAVLPAAVLAAGLLLIQQHLQNEEIRVAAEIDAVLLADDLPPAAYADPGFLEFLRQGEPRREPSGD